MKYVATLVRGLFTRNHQRYEGVRPVNVYLLRLLYALMFLFVGFDSWSFILNHEGPWDPVHAVAWCAWAAYATLAGLGILHPLRMLPILLFMFFYKALWLGAVAYPLWAAGELAGTRTGAMAEVFIWVLPAALVVPWGYAFRTFVLGRKAVHS